MSAYCMQTPAEAPETVLPPKPVHLSRRQQEVLVLLGEGLSNKRIARALDITEGTVKQHIKCVLDELGASNRLQAVIYAYRKGALPQVAERISPSEESAYGLPAFQVLAR
jgi:DNA-binding NarL/FixJ family response regulator